MNVSDEPSRSRRTQFQTMYRVFVAEHARPARLFGVAAVALALAATPAPAVNDVAGSLIQFNDNGAWSWFEDERAIVDSAAGKILVSSVANSAGAGGAARHGDVEVAALDLATGQTSRFTLADALQADDQKAENPS